MLIDISINDFDRIRIHIFIQKELYPANEIQMGESNTNYANYKKENKEYERKY